MTALEKLDLAIESGDIKKIKAARKLLAKTPKATKVPKIATVESDEESLETESPDISIPDDDGSGDGKRQCVKRPLDTGPRKNKYNDRGQSNEDVEIDQKLLKKLVQTGRESARPAHKKVKARCRDCSNAYMVDPTMHILTGNIEGHAITFLCSNCLNKKIGR